MGQLTGLIALALLCCQCLAVKPQQVTLDYEGKVVVRNAATDDTHSYWAFSAKLIAQVISDEKCVFQLEDVKTTISNGPDSTSELKQIPDSAKVLLHPFVFIHEKDNFVILHQPDETIWSVNMKRAIVNNLYMHPYEKDTTVHEHTLYGNCEVHYTVEQLEDGSGTVLTKEVNHTSCDEDPSTNWSNVNWDQTATNNPIYVSTKRVYSFQKGHEIYDEVDSWSNFTYQAMPSVVSTQHVDQHQKAKVVSITEDYQPIDISKNTEKVKLTFSDIRDAVDESEMKYSPEEITSLIEGAFKDIQKHYNKPYLTNEVEEISTVDEVYTYLFQMDKAALTDLTTKTLIQGSLIESKALQAHVFLSILPYVGTNFTIDVVKDLIVEDNLNDLLAIKLLATFPNYVNDATVELLKNLEVLMHLDGVENIQVKYTGILSFATLVCNAKDNNDVTDEVVHKYVEKYYKLFEEKQEYEQKMTYLLGLINMGACIDVDLIYPIITNKDELRHLRALATYGFKKYLIDDGNKVYEHFWPIVTATSEPFEVRVAALDVLLTSQLSKEQFQNVVDHFHVRATIPSEQHLANYFYTTLVSIRNVTGYYEYLGEFATETLEHNEFPTYSKAWTTGNYRLAFTDDDSNFGGSFDTKLVADPLTNVINVAQFKYDSFAISLNLGEFVAYVKIEGVSDSIFRDNREMGVEQLLDLIRKNNFKIEAPEDFHVEVILFNNKRAVFGMYVDKDNIKNFSENGLWVDLLKLIVDYNSVSFPVMDYNYYVSDVGTLISVVNDITEITTYELENFDKLFDDEASNYTMKYRYAWWFHNYVHCFNPILSTNAGTYKYHKDEVLVRQPFTFNSTEFSIILQQIPDSFNYICDRKIGTYVRDHVENLNDYCKNCVAEYEVPIGEYNKNPIKNSTFLASIGTVFNVTKTSSPVQRELDLHNPHSILSPAISHQSNTFDIPLAEPVLRFWHLMMYSTYLDKDIRRESFRTIPYYNEPNEIMVQLEIDDEDEDEDNKNDDDDPIDGTDFSLALHVTSRRVHDAYVNNHWNTSFKYHSGPKVIPGHAQHHIQDRYIFTAQYTTDINESRKVCLNREVLYPPRVTDKLSIDPVDPAKGVITFSWGAVEPKTAHLHPEICGIDGTLIFTEIYEGTEKQTKAVKATEEYEKCKIQSKGLKHVPPTHECIAVHESISRYDHSELHINISQVDPSYSEELNTFPTSEYGFKILEYNRINDTHVSINFPDQVIEKTRESSNALANKLSSMEVTDTGFFSMLAEDPMTIAYDDYDVEVGLASTCVLSPHTVTTFWGKTVKGYNSGDKSPVAYVECYNGTENGLTVQKISEHQIGFTMWSLQNKLVVTIDDGKLKVTLNDEEKTKESHEYPEHFKIYFLEDDVLYIIADGYEVYYNTEYVSVKIYSAFLHHLCGHCVTRS